MYSSLQIVERYVDFVAKIYYKKFPSTEVLNKKTIQVLQIRNLVFVSLYQCIS
jgi:hypothetical protein